MHNRLAMRVSDSATYRDEQGDALANSQTFAIAIVSDRFRRATGRFGWTAEQFHSNKGNLGVSRRRTEYAGDVLVLQAEQRIGFGFKASQGRAIQTVTVFSMDELLKRQFDEC